MPTPAPQPHPPSTPPSFPSSGAPPTSGSARPPSPVRPWLFVPVLYVMQAIPNTLACEVSSLFYKDLGVANPLIVLWVSMLRLPWTLKLLWAPLVDLNFTRRRWILAAQAVIVAALAALAAAIHLPAFFPVTLAILFLVGFASATHDIALDGLYLLALTKPQQAYFVGILTTAFRAGRLLCIGGLVFAAGLLHTRGMTYPACWAIAFAAIAALYAAGSAYAWLFVPHPPTDVPAAAISPRENRGNILRTFLALALGAAIYGILYASLKLAGHRISLSLSAAKSLASWQLDPAAIRTSFWIFGLSLASLLLLVPLVRLSFRRTAMAEAFSSFARQKRFPAILAFMLFYRFSEAMVLAVAPLFMRDPHAAGGLGLSTEQVGAINGAAGVAGIILGGISGGALIGKLGLKKCLWPLVLCMHAPNLLYLWAAHALPPVWTIYFVAFTDQFGYGFGFAGYSVFLMHIAQRGGGRFRTSHYAIATGLGSLMIMLAGMFSSILLATLTYPAFFLIVCLCTLPGMLTLFFIPLGDTSVRDSQ